MSKPTSSGGPRVSSGADSKQDYATPPEFIAAVEKRFGRISLDLAAHAGNTKAARWYGPGGEREDSFREKWADPALSGGGLLWLNPPFSDIGPWAAKCAAESQRGARVAFLVPASVGSGWFRDHVARHAAVNLLNDRICFDGKNVFPKDCMLALYGETPGMCIWGWKRDVVHARWICS